MKNNFFTTKLLDILVPVTEEKHLEDFNSIFFIMDYAEMDMHGLFSNPNVKISDAHVATILYNLLCGLLVDGRRPVIVAIGDYQFFVECVAKKSLFGCEWLVC